MLARPTVVVKISNKEYRDGCGVANYRRKPGTSRLSLVARIGNRKLRSSGLAIAGIKTQESFSHLDQL